VFHWAERRGLSSGETHLLLDLASAMGACGLLRPKVLLGRISVPAAAELGKVLADRSFLVPGDDWVSFAEDRTARDVTRAVRRRLAEVRGGGPVAVLTVHLTAAGKDAFDRARDLLSRGAGRVLGDGETVEALAGHYLDAEDPLRKENGTRRLPDTASLPGERYIPSAVRREVSGRTGDRCQVPCCGNRVFVDYAHRRAHALGGDREARNLLRLCRAHHRMLDAGRISARGPSEAPKFYTPDGMEIAARAPP